jgi:predicted protein tyrosine phosphatase
LNTIEERKTMSTPLAPPAPGSLSVGGLTQATKFKRKFDAIISLQDPKAKTNQKLVFNKGPIPPRLVVACEDFDLSTCGVIVATEDQMAEIIDFGRMHASGSLLIHCMHGIGRSAAAALTILADRMGRGEEAAAYAHLNAMRPECAPNLVMVALADRLLGRGGTLIAAVRDAEATMPAKLQRRANRLAYYEENRELYAHHPS